MGTTVVHNLDGGELSPRLSPFPEGDAVHPASPARPDGSPSSGLSRISCLRCLLDLRAVVLPEG
jgi:hypothetical protein